MKDLPTSRGEAPWYQSELALTLAALAAIIFLLGVIAF